MSIEDFINNVADKDFTAAQSGFEELMKGRMQDALEQQKVAVAGAMFGEEDGTDDITDEDIEAALDEDDAEDIEDTEDDAEDTEDEE